MADRYYQQILIPSAGVYFLVPASDIQRTVPSTPLPNVPELNTVADVLRYYRRLHKLSLYALAKRTGLHRGHITSHETEKGPRIQQRTINALAQVYGKEFVDTIHQVLKRSRSP